MLLGVSQSDWSCPVVLVLLNMSWIGLPLPAKPAYGAFSPWQLQELQSVRGSVLSESQKVQEKKMGEKILSSVVLLQSATKNANHVAT